MKNFFTGISISFLILFKMQISRSMNIVAQCFDAVMDMKASVFRASAVVTCEEQFFRIKVNAIRLNSNLESF